MDVDDTGATASGAHAAAMAEENAAEDATPPGPEAAGVQAGAVVPLALMEAAEKGKTPAPEAAAAAGGGPDPDADDGEEEEDMCRYCFGGREDGPLISPCLCSGGQKFVHLDCLRRWQRMVLVSQPTHPMFYEDDVRHHKCNVCMGSFTCAPPTRAELMESFTGPELAALIDVKSLIGSHIAFSEELDRNMEGLPRMHPGWQNMAHWNRGSFVITSVAVDDGELELPIEDESMLETILERMDEDGGGTLDLGGKKLKLSAKASLAGVATEDLFAKFKALVPPAKVFFADVSYDRVVPNCGNDHVTAVNLARPIDAKEVPSPRAVTKAIQAVCSRYPSADAVELVHHIGGPCHDEQIATCMVLGGGGCGWTFKESLEEAMVLAHGRAAQRHNNQGGFASGQTVRLKGLKARPELNGEVGLALRFNITSSRWTVRLRNGDGKKVKSSNLEPLEGRYGRVYVFWGDAQWSRAQLLGEIARGSWGLCKASVADVTVPAAERWANLKDRLAFAPVTDMSEGYIREAEQQMNALRPKAQQAAIDGRNPSEEAGEEHEADEVVVAAEAAELNAVLQPQQHAAAAADVRVHDGSGGGSAV